MTLFSFLPSLPSGFSTLDIGLVLIILGLSALMSGLSGFGFSAIGALCLWIIPPKLGVPLLMSLSCANQLMSLGQLKAELKPLRDWWPQGPAPYLLGGCVGVPIGLMILQSLPTLTLMAVFGVILLAYAIYAVVKPDNAHLTRAEGWGLSALVGIVGGVIGGFTAFPGAAVVVWSGLRRLGKAESRAIVQPYILGMQVISLMLLAVQHPGTFSPTFWRLLVFTIPVVLPCTLLGVKLYQSLSDINFRRVSFGLLGTSGFGLLLKAAAAFLLMATVARVAVR